MIGPPDTAYEGGYFHGKLQFPADFPFKPPSILMLTPNGRFKINQRLWSVKIFSSLISTKFSLSISDFHPDTWNPAWSAGTILTGLLSFMVEEATTYGSIETPNAVRQRLARDSGAENLRNEKFVELFPDLVNEINAKLEKRKAQAKPVKKVENEPETSAATNARTNLRAVNNQQSDNGLSNMAIFAMITLLVLSVSAVSFLKRSNNIVIQFFFRFFMEKASYLSCLFYVSSSSISHKKTKN